jgi:hypothetical protein
MVQFNETGYTITIDTHGNPIENWFDMKCQLLKVLSCLDSELDIETYEVFNLLSSMELNLEQAQKVFPYSKKKIDTELSLSKKTA